MKNYNNLQKDIRSEIAGISFLALALLVFLCLINPSLGVIGKYISKILEIMAGEGRFFFPVILGTSGLYLLSHKNKKQKKNGSISGFLLLLLVTLTVLHLPVPLDYALVSGFNGDGGGLVGALSSFVLQKSFGLVGTYIILVTLTIVSMLILTKKSFVYILISFYKKIMTTIKNFRHKLTDVFFTEEPEEKKINKTTERSWDYSSDMLEDAYEEQAAGLENPLKEEDDKPVDPEPALYPKDRKEEKVIQPGEMKKTEPEPEDNGGEYKFPPLDLLARPPSKKDSRAEKNLHKNVKKLESTLESFGVRARVSKVAQGPAITRYEIQPPPGIKVSKIVNLADDIALGMAAPDVRIEAPIPGKAAMGIEVPNQEVSMVYLRELIESKFFTQSTSKLTLALGKDVAGKPVGADLQKMPHLLIAGATGAGKSVCLNTIIASILYKATPSEVKFLIIDPKMVELATFNGIPHLVSPVVTDPKKAATSLRWAVREMEKRYEIFADAGVRDIFRYNNLVKDKENEYPLPFIVIIIDELADLMMVAPTEVEDAVCRLAQMSRAAGMHLVIATQRPSVDVITGLIKANIPSRLSFAVSSGIDSRTIMDTSGAEKLLGKGDMLFYPVGAAKPKRVQGAFLSDVEVDLLVEHLKKQAEPQYEEKFLESENPYQQAQLEDVLLPRAVRIVLEAGHASISMLQRRLHIGYSRAARLIDIMERKGIVGGFEGSKPRSVLITQEEYEKTYMNHRGKE